MQKFEIKATYSILSEIKYLVSLIQVLIAMAFSVYTL